MKRTVHPYTIEIQQRALRVWEYLTEAELPVLIKDIRRDLGLSYSQARIALDLLERAKIVHITVTARWNGRNYIHPHRIWLS